MTTIVRLRPAELDEILALQFTVAWAGEAAGEPPRLGWWKSDLVDPEGGGDLFARLVPRTAAWASLALVRLAAQGVDAAARDPLQRPPPALRAPSPADAGEGEGCAPSSRAS